MGRHPPPQCQPCYYQPFGAWLHQISRHMVTTMTLQQTSDDRDYEFSIQQRYITKIKMNDNKLLKNQIANLLPCGGYGYCCCGGSLVKGKDKLQSAYRKRLLEEGDCNYNGTNRKRVMMTAHQIIKQRLTGKVDMAR